MARLFSILSFLAVLSSNAFGFQFTHSEATPRTVSECGVKRHKEQFSIKCGHPGFRSEFDADICGVELYNEGKGLKQCDRTTRKGLGTKLALIPYGFLEGSCQTVGTRELLILEEFLKERAGIPYQSTLIERDEA